MQTGGHTHFGLHTRALPHTDLQCGSVVAAW